MGCTGFVGGTLSRQRQFDGLYHSRNIDEIAGQSFDMVVCAAAPATMWAANQNPEADKANLDRLADVLTRVNVGNFVLISTIAVFDNPAAGYTEASAVYETQKAYGRHRRQLEERFAAHFPRCHVLRLPALFGPGLKKNFIFDLMNPLPSFIKPDRFDETASAFSPADAALLRRWYALDAALGMWALDRAGLAASPDSPALTAAFEAIGFVSRNFTNSASRFQYYNMARLAVDIDTVVGAGLAAVNICSEPLEAATIARELTGQAFANDGPPQVAEDMRSDHAALFGGSGPYLFGREAVLADLKAFYTAQTAT